MKKKCGVCNEWFEAKGSYQRKCLDCWKREKNEEVRRAGYQAGWNEGFRVGSKSKKNQLDEEFLMDLLRLCHPDRHPVERASLANRVSAQINFLREKLK